MSEDPVPFQPEPAVARLDYFAPDAAPAELVGATFLAAFFTLAWVSGGVYLSILAWVESANPVVGLTGLLIVAGVPIGLAVRAKHVSRRRRRAIGIWIGFAIALLIQGVCWANLELNL